MDLQLSDRLYHILDGFIKDFLKKFYPIHKITLIRKNIMQFKKEPSEPFWRYFERFKDSLSNVLIIE